MPEVNVQQAEQKPSETQAKPDLITRVSQAKITTPSVPITEPEFDFKEIDEISDPAMKEKVLKAYKSFQRGFNEKFQTMASLRKDYENKMNEFSNWSPERVQQLINDPKFVEAARNVIGTQGPNGQSGEEQSFLSDADKQRIKSLESELSNLKSASWQQTKTQEDGQLKTKFANYNPEAVDIITNDMLTGKLKATREHLWKVIDYDEAVQRAYELGKQDRKLEQDEKSSSVTFSPNASPIAPPGGQMTPEKDESDRAFLQRIFARNAEKLQRK